MKNENEDEIMRRWGGAARAGYVGDFFFLCALFRLCENGNVGLIFCNVVHASQVVIRASRSCQSQAVVKEALF